MHSLKGEAQISQSLGEDNLRKWIIAIRPSTLFASISPVIMGISMAYADRVFHLPSALLALIGAIFIQTGTNLANDYYDFIHGVDGPDRIGPPRVTQMGLIKPESIKRAFIISFGIAVVSGSYLVIRAGIPILVIGILSIVFGIIYTAGPFSLANLGLADPLVILFFGPMAVAGTYYVQALDIKGYVIIAGIAPGFISNAMLVVNNLRDIDTDRRSGKKTLAVRFGRKFARAEYIISLIIPFIIPFFLISPLHHYHLFCCASFMLCFPYVKLLWKEPSIHYNKLLKTNAVVLFVYSILFSSGWMIG